MSLTSRSEDDLSTFFYNLYLFNVYSSVIILFIRILIVFPNNNFKSYLRLNLMFTIIIHSSIYNLQKYIHSLYY